MSRGDVAAAARVCVLLAWVTCAGCGGAGSGSATAPSPAAPPVTSPPSPTAPPPSPAQNRPPVLLKDIPNQIGSEGHSFNFDVSQGGTVFSDPDNDPLSYALTTATPITLSMVGTRVVGTLPLSAPSLISVSIMVDDGHGGTAQTKFQLQIVPNAPPVLSSPNYAVVVPANAQLAYDPTKSGSTFTDPEGDRITYELTIRSPPRGLSVDGALVVGALADVGVVTFELKATDAFGAVAVDKFSVVVAAPEPPEPVLPHPTHVYADAALALPQSFKVSIERPRDIFWDTPTGDNPITNEGATLGRVLFYDKRLSVTNTHSCSSCHEQARGFASAKRFDVGVLGIPMKRNAMALANVRFNRTEAWFWDMRATPLEALALMPIEEPTELGSYLPQLEAKLAASDFYPPLFEAAFGSPVVTRERIGKAIAQFLRSLMTYRSRFDEAFSGEHVQPGLLTPEEQLGRTVFFTYPNGCAFCHTLNIQTVEEARNNGLDPTITDPGVIVAGVATGRFRPPSLRNIAVSAPYMHDGRFATLREVIEHYVQGVQGSLALDPVLREGGVSNGAVRRLTLREDEKDGLEAYLRLLTDDVFLVDPKFSDPFH